MSNSSIVLSTLSNASAISSLTEDTSPDIAADFVPTFDASATANKKVKLVNLPGAWNYISTATASTSASITFTGLTSAYRMYRVMIQHYIPSTNATDLWMRTSTDGGANYDAGATDYRTSALSQVDNSAFAVAVTSNSAFIIAVASTSYSLGTGTSQELFGNVDIHTPSNATNCWFYSDTVCLNSGGYGNKDLNHGYRAAAADVDAIQFLSSSGNIASGTFTLYGVK